nr:MAG TPA: hypothetical protein [Caudoviricetes sp.]
MIAIVEMTIRTRIINTMGVQMHRKRVENGNALIATNMWVNPNSEQHIAGRKWVMQNEDFKQEEIQ